MKTKNLQMSEIESQQKINIHKQNVPRNYTKIDIKSYYIATHIHQLEGNQTIY